MSLFLEVQSHWLLGIWVSQGTLVLSPSLTDLPLSLPNILTLVSILKSFLPISPGSCGHTCFTGTDVQASFAAASKVIFDGNDLAAVLDLKLRNEFVVVGSLVGERAHTTGFI